MAITSIQDLKNLSFEQLGEILSKAKSFNEQNMVWVEWERRLSCEAYVREGILDAQTGEFIAEDGFKWKSIGCVEYGNDNFWEVMVLAEKPKQVPCTFAGTPVDNYPVFFANHDDFPITLGQSREEFLAQVPPHHMNYILIQLGSTLARY